MAGDVGGVLGEEVHLGAVEGGRRVGDDFERLEVDVDQRRRVAGGLPGLGDDDCQRLPDEADAVLGQARTGKRRRHHLESDPGR